MDEAQKASQFLDSLKANLSQVMVGKEQAVDMLLTALICGGHVLIEDLPGHIGAGLGKILKLFL